MFPTGLVLGVYNKETWETVLNPPAARRIHEGDVLVMMRPTGIAAEDYNPTPEPVPIDLGVSHHATVNFLLCSMRLLPMMACRTPKYCACYHPSCFAV